MYFPASVQKTQQTKSKKAICRNFLIHAPQRKTVPHRSSQKNRALRYSAFSPPGPIHFALKIQSFSHSFLSGQFLLFTSLFLQFLCHINKMLFQHFIGNCNGNSII